MRKDYLMNGFSIKKVKEYFASEGQIKKIVTGYRCRSEQVCLSEKIAEAFINEEFLVAEAGTGIGKTFAYLVPSVLWAVNTKEKLVISTKTKALQQQLIERDIIDLQKIIAVDFSYAEAKGRDNYLCWNKYEKIRTGKVRLKGLEIEFIESILEWAEQTKTGDRRELLLDSKLMKNWDIVASDRKTCLKGNCRYREKCFHLQMIKKLEKADIIIVNHALLLSDIIVNNCILPEYKYLVIDEAHTFIREAFTRMSLDFPFRDTIDILRILNYQENPDKGYIKYLADKYLDLKKLLEDINSLAKTSILFIEGLFWSLSREMGADSSYHYSLVLAETGVEVLKNRYQRGKENINLLVDKLILLKKELQKREEEEIITIIEVLKEYLDNAFTIIEEDVDNEGKIVWADFNKGKAVSVCSSNVDIGEILCSRLYGRLNSMVMVSATITIEEKFDFFCTLSGLSLLSPKERVSSLLQKSPFDYDSQACVYIAKDMPAPGSSTYNQELYRALGDIFTITGGRTLVLFTSRKQMKEAGRVLRPICNNAGLRLLVQYEDGEFGLLMDEFTKCHNTILMGVETFWEGIDLKGELLKYLVIVRLPFRPPSDPYCNAGNKHFTLLNKNAFINFTIPDTVVRFKQGIGRLIRSENDTGAVIVLDNRLGKRSYTRMFINSIPIKKVICCEVCDIRRHIIGDK
jgi:ATP-dependent DNA helicase DinG